MPDFIFIAHKIAKCNKDKVVYYVTTTYKRLRDKDRYLLNENYLYNEGGTA